MIAFEHVDCELGGRLVLKDVTHVFEPATISVVRGPSGSGKSTLLNLARGYVKPTCGSVQSSGITDYLLQEDLLLSELTVRENLRCRMAAELPQQVDVMTALDRVGLAGKVDSRAGSLSGGERRRVELASTIMLQPQNLLLDEPVANLDPASRAAVYSAIWSMFPTQAVVIVTHEELVPGLPPESIQLVIDQGRLHEAH